MRQGMTMWRPARAAVIAGALCSAATAATIHRVDDTTVDGEPTAVIDGRLMVATKAATRPVSVPLADVAQVVFRRPPDAPAAPDHADAVKPAVKVVHHHHSGSLFSAVVSSLTGTNEVVADEQVETTPVPVADAAAAQPPPTIRLDKWLLTLTGGDRLHAAVDTWDGGLMTVRPAAATAPVAVPAARVTMIWLVDPAAAARARALVPADVGTDDVALVQKDPATVVPVRGQALGLSGDALLFRYDGHDRRLATAKLVGVVLNRPPAVADAPPARQRFAAQLSDGDAVTGEWVGLDHNQLTLRMAWGQPLRLTVGSVYRLSGVGGRLAYLSDLRPAAVEQGGYFGRAVPYRIDQSITGGPIRLADGTHDRGVATHARCRLAYTLGGDYDRFRSTVGFEQPDGTAARAALKVIGDGRVLYDAPHARGDEPPAHLDLDVTGVRQLVLLVDFGDDAGLGVRARVDWADARLVRRSAGGAK